MNKQIPLQKDTTIFNAHSEYLVLTSCGERLMKQAVLSSGEIFFNKISFKTEVYIFNYIFQKSIYIYFIMHWEKNIFIPEVGLSFDIHITMYVVTIFKKNCFKKFNISISYYNILIYQGLWDLYPYMYLNILPASSLTPSLQVQGVN